MGKTNHKIMFIKDLDVLSEKNYEGNRLILIEDEKLDALVSEIEKEKVAIKPKLDELEAVTNELDPAYTEIRELQERITSIKETMQPTQDKYEALKPDLDAFKDKIDLIQNKMRTIINEFVADKLKPFEKALQTQLKDDKMYVEVQDELEEFLKKHRASKINKETK